jgi:hypothetical protein
MSPSANYLDSERILLSDLFRWARELEDKLKTGTGSIEGKSESPAGASPREPGRMKGERRQE